MKNLGGGRVGGVNPEMEKWGKMMIQVQFMFIFYLFFTPFIQKSFLPRRPGSREWVQNVD